MLLLLFSSGSADSAESTSDSAPNGGRSRRIRTQFRVVMDGEELLFDSLAEAEQALDRAVEVAEEVVAKAAVVVRQGTPIVTVPQAPPKITFEGPDTAGVEKLRREILAVYRSAIEKAQKARQAEIDDEEALALLL